MLCWRSFKFAKGGEDKQIEDAVSLCNVCEKGYCVLG